MRKQKLSTKAVFFLYAGFVTYVSLKPASGLSIGQWDKAGHLFIYAIFTLLGYRVASNTRTFLYLCIGIIVYSGLMEVFQSFTPGRQMSAYDLLANIIGVATGAFIAQLALDKNKRQANRH